MTDFVQLGIIVVGLVVLLIVVIVVMGGWSAAWSGVPASKFRPGLFLHPTARRSACQAGWAFCGKRKAER